MKRLIASVILSVLFMHVSAQTWTLLPTPYYNSSLNTKLVSDNPANQLIIVSGEWNTDSLYAKTGQGNWISVGYGEYLDAFYSNNGTLFLLNDTNPTITYAPKIFKSSDNGITKTEVSGISGRGHYRDGDGDIFLTAPTGFKYSTDDGSTFTDVTTPTIAYSAANDNLGNLYYGSDSLRLWKSIDGGNTWTDISKNINPYSYITYLQFHNNTFYFDDRNGSYLYGSTTDPAWLSVQPGVTSTSWVSGLTITDNAYYIHSPYGLYEAVPWGNWTEILSSWSGTSQWFGAYLNQYSVSDTIIYARTDTGFIHTDLNPVVSGINGFTSSSNNLIIFPNPVNDILRIKGLKKTANLEITVYNIQGQVIKRTTTNIISVDELDAGVYFIQIWEDKMISSMSFLKH